MGRLRSTGTRRLLRVLALVALAIGALATWALAAGSGGWDHVGTGNHAGGDSLDATANALQATPAGLLYVGGAFTDAGGVLNADRIAKWNGSSWSAVSSSTSQITNGQVSAIAVSGGKVYVGGTFTQANDDANNLAVWDGDSWEPACNDTLPGPAFDGNVTSLQIIGQLLYVGGEFHDAAHKPAADYLVRCHLQTRAASPTVVDEAHAIMGSVYALTADSNGTLYAGGTFIDLNQIPQADYVAALPEGGTWEPMAGGLPAIVRGLTAVGTDVYVGTNADNVAGPNADFVVKWNGSAWSALGSNTADDDGWFPAGTSIYGLAAGPGSNLFVTGSFQDANGDPRADMVAWFDGNAWHPLGHNGSNNDGPLPAEGHALAIVDRQLYAAGAFTSAGGDPQARAVASYGLSQVIAYPTPTVTAGPSAVPTPTVTPGPSAVPTPTVTPPPAAADTTAPRTSLRASTISQAARKATFRFASGEAGSRFSCKLDKKKYKRCTSPKTYKKLKLGKHVFRVKARDRAGNVDRTPIVKRFRIKRQGGR